MLEETKIIFIDLDGTLLNDKRQITKYTKNIIKKVTQRGIYVVLCSGRANNELIEKSKEASASSIVISNNGALIFDYKLNCKIFESKISKDILTSIWNFAQNNNIGLTYNSTYERYKNKNSKKKATIIDNIEEIGDNVTQIVAETKNYSSIKKMKEIIEKKYQEIEMKNLVTMKNEAEFEIDISNKFNSKGNSINKILEFLHINKEHSVCFGDQINDFTMFQSCGTKIAMNNGNEQLKKEADLITLYNNNEDGVARFIEKYIL